MQSERRLARIFLCQILTAVSLAPGAMAQEAGPVPLSAGVSTTTFVGGGGNSASSGGSAGLFRIPNFVGDERVSDLYYFMHPFDHPQWDVYQERLRAAARRIENMQPLQNSPTPDQANGSPGNVMSGYGAQAINAGSQMLGSNQNNQNSSYPTDANGNYYPSGQGRNVSTNVTGQVVTPGLVE